MHHTTSSSLGLSKGHPHSLHTFLLPTCTHSARLLASQLPIVAHRAQSGGRHEQGQAPPRLDAPAVLRLHRRLHPDARRRRRVHRARHLPRPAPLQAILLPPGCTAPLHRPQRPCPLPYPPGDHRIAEPERPGGHLLQDPGRVHDVPRRAGHGAGGAAADLPGAQGRVGVVAGDVGGLGAGGAVPGGRHEAGHRRRVRATAREGLRPRQVEGRHLGLRRVRPLRQLSRPARGQRQRRRRRLRHERHGGRRRRRWQRDRLAQVRAGGGLHRRRVTLVDAVHSRVPVWQYARMLARRWGSYARCRLEREVERRARLFAELIL